MRRHESKLQRANVVAGFDSQDSADEALLELRSVGLPDRRIGYYYQAGRGRMVDLLAGRHRFAAAVIWAAVGAAAGVGVVFLLDRAGAAGPDRAGLAVTLGVCGALLLGTAGGIMGLWAERPGDDIPAGDATPYVMSVEAGGTGGRVWEILCRHGGHAVPHTPVPVQA
jgi:hypothetical protein